MTKTTILCCIAVAALVLTFSCSQNRKDQRSPSARPAAQEESSKTKESGPTFYESNSQTEKSDATKDEETKPHDLSSGAAHVSDKDGMRFIRTADIRFQVGNVPDATYEMEDITVRYGGFVTFTDLHSMVNRKESVAVSEDSSLEVTWYTVQNDITLRLPNTRMDSALKAITALVGFLDHRTIRADEISGQLLSNELSAQRNTDHAQHLNKALDDRQVRSGEVTDAANEALAGRERSDEARLANRSLDNQIKYSTLHFVIYQRESVRRVRVASEKDIPHYEQPLIYELRDAAITGWYIVKHVLVFLVHGWAFILMGVVAWIVYRRRKG